MRSWQSSSGATLASASPALPISERNKTSPNGPLELWIVVIVEEDERFVPTVASEDAPQPFALSLEEFIASEQESAGPPLLGTDDEQILPVGGLAILAGQGGIGKTTLVLDLAFHAASGLDWLGMKIRRPLNVLLIENEGPQEQFRIKLKRKREAWKPTIEADIFTQVWEWASFTLLDDEGHSRMGSFCERNAVDLVIGDPLDSLGVEGVGSPQDTREFVRRLRTVGLTQTRTFLFLHHFRKEKAADEIDQVQGAWGARLDSLLVLKPTLRASELRLSFPKVRWSDRQRKPLILGKIENTKSFESLGEENDLALLDRPIVEFMEANPGWHTLDELRAAVNAARKRVQEWIESNDHLVRAAPGAIAGRPKAKLVFRLLDQLDSEPNQQAEPTETSPSGLFAVPDPDPDEEDEW